jgi:hypothetical protein
MFDFSIHLELNCKLEMCLHRQVALVWTRALFTTTRPGGTHKVCGGAW